MLLANERDRLLANAGARRRRYPVLCIASAKSLNVIYAVTHSRHGCITYTYVYKADSHIELLHGAKLIASNEAR